ncbi:MAG: 2-iminoacetate synthase ThiH, partial [Blautia sp.]
DKINPRDVHEPQLLQIITAYRLFMPYAGITISSRESACFRDHVIQIAATKISAGVSTGVGSHTEEIQEQGDNQFEIDDNRDVGEIRKMILSQGMQPVTNDYVCLTDREKALW